MAEAALDADTVVRLAALANRYELGEATALSLGKLLELLAADPHAPTTVRAPAVAVDAHIADALVALELPELRGAGVLADLGSGAGVPGLVLAAALPKARVALVESNRRKCEFIARAIDRMGIANAVVVNERVEAWVAGRAAHDAITARALAPLNVVAEYAAPLLRVGGTLVAWTGKPEPQVERDAAAAASALGLSKPRSLVVTPFEGALHHRLTVMSKLSPTPAAFPRRVGVARKRPLDAAGGRRSAPEGAPASDRTRR